MDFKNWFLLFLILGIAGFSGYNIYNSSITVPEKPTKTSHEITPTKIVAGESFSIPENWEEYDGETIKFNYPPEWQPEEKQPFGGSVVEDVNLNIPESTEDSIFYSVTRYDIVKPEDLESEKTYEINGRTWTEWIRKGEGYVSYEYFTNENIRDDAESFGLYVTLPEENGKIKEKLLDFLATIEFESDDITSAPTLTLSLSPTPSPASTVSADLLE